MRLAIALITFAALATAQEAKVMILERGDTYDLQQAYKQYKDALKHWDEVKVKVAAHYTLEGSGKDAKTIPGWEKVQFSPDFRAIVPEDSRYASTGRSCYLTGWGNTITTPLSGTTTSGNTPLVWDSSSGLFTVNGTAAVTGLGSSKPATATQSYNYEGLDESRELGIARDLIVKEK